MLANFQVQITNPLFYISGEMVKFQLYPKSEALHCVKVSPY